MAKKVVKKNNQKFAIFISNFFGFVNYLLVAVSYLLVASLLVAFIFEVTNIVPVEVVTAPPAENNAQTEAGISILQSIITIAALAIVIGSLVWIFAKAPPAFAKYSSKLTQIVASHIPLKSTFKRFIYAKIFLTIVPAICMLLLYATVWQSSIGLPILIIVASLVFTAILAAILQFIVAHSAVIDESDLL